MPTFIYIACELIILISFLLYFYKRLSKTIVWKSFVLNAILLIVTTWFVMEAFNKLDQFLFKKEIYIELGHASMLNAIIWLLSLVAVFSVILISAINKNKS